MPKGKAMTRAHQAYAARKKAGRPMICITMAQATLTELDRQREGISRGDFIAWLLDQVNETPEAVNRPQPPPGKGVLGEK